MVSISHNIDVAARKLQAYPKQIRFAASRAVNDTAKDVQDFTVKTLLPAKFTLRSRGAPWWKPGTRMGFNIRPFSKPSTLTAIVGSQADWLKLQEQGGTKKPDSGKRLAIVSGARPTPTAVIPRQVKPKRLLSGRKPKGFVVTTEKGSGIFVRAGDDVKMMYWLKPTAIIKPVLQFLPNAMAVVTKSFPKHFVKRFTEAMKTAR